jgi:hypothetical protein
LALAILIAGCGGSDEGSNGGQASVQEVNAACKASDKKAVSEIKKAYRTATANGVSSEREGIQLEASVLVPVLIAEAESQLAAIDSLEVPDGEEAQVRRILDAYRSWIKKAKGTPFKVVVANDVYNHARELVGKYGLRECGLNPFEEPTP